MDAPRGRRSLLPEGALVLGLLVLAATLLYVPREVVELEFDRSAYTAQSIGLAEGQGNTIRVGDLRFPGFYPPVFPATIAPFHWLLGQHPQNGVFASLGWALATLLVVYLLGRRLGGPAAGAAAALLLLGNVQFERMAQSVLTQTAALCSVAVAAHLLVARPDARSRAARWGLAAGLVAGLSLLIRYQNFILVAGLSLYALLAPGAAGPRARLRAALPVWVGVALGGAVVMAYCAVAYGSPLRTGYHVWDFPFERSFALKHFFEPAFIQETPPRDFFLLRCLVGLGPLYPLAIAVLWLVGIAVAWRQRAAHPALHRANVLTLVVNAVLFTILGLYVFRSAIYAMLGLPLVMVMAAVGLSWWFRGRHVRGVPLLAVAVLLAALPLLGTASRSHLFGRGEGPEPLMEQTVLAHADRELERDAVLLGYADPILAQLVFVRQTDRRYLYLHPDILPRLREQVRAELGGGDATPEEVARYVAAHLEAGRGIYFVVPLPKGRPTDPQAVLDLHAFLAQRFRFSPSPVAEIQAIAR